MERKISSRWYEYICLKFERYLSVETVVLPLNDRVRSVEQVAVFSLENRDDSDVLKVEDDHQSETVPSQSMLGWSKNTISFGPIFHLFPTKVVFK